MRRNAVARRRRGFLCSNEAQARREDAREERRCIVLRSVGDEMHPTILVARSPRATQTMPAPSR